MDKGLFALSLLFNEFYIETIMSEASIPMEVSLSNFIIWSYSLYFANVYICHRELPILLFTMALTTYNDT